MQVLTAPSSTAAGEGRLTVALHGTIPASVVTAFESSTGCALTIRSELDSEIARSVREGGANVPDVVAVPSDLASELAQSSSLQPLDRSGLPDLSKLDAAFRSTSWANVGGRPAGVADLWTADVLAYRTDLLNRPPNSIGTIFDSSIRGPIVLPDSISTVADMNLLAGASDPFAASPEILAASQKLLLSLPTNRRILISTTDELDSALGTGAARVGLARTNDLASLIRNGRPVAWVVPAEGATAIARTWAIPVGSRRSTCAYRWLEKILQPDTQAAFSQLTGLAPTTPAACAILPGGWCQADGEGVSGLIRKLSIATVPGPDVVAADVGDIGAVWQRVKAETAEAP